MPYARQVPRRLPRLQTLTRAELLEQIGLLVPEARVLGDCLIVFMSNNLILYRSLHFTRPQLPEL